MGKHGKPLTVSRYMTAVREGHPTAHADGRVRVHRANLYDKIGPGVHQCFWCTTEIEWFELGCRALVADHVDADTWNNDPSNLVASCIPCNTARPSWSRTECIRGHEYSPENTYWRPDGGGRQCRTCNKTRASRRNQKGSEAA